MKKKPRAKSFWKITMPKIRKYAMEIAERFDPDKIILFGSQARGDTHYESDVDVMVIMEAKNGLDQAVKIRWAIRAPFPVDLLVCSPKKWQRRLEDGESFICDLEENGKVLYAKQDATVGQESRGRLQHRALPGRKQASLA
jgi:predicted nucleotidyltransferase